MLGLQSPVGILKIHPTHTRAQPCTLSQRVRKIRRRRRERKVTSRSEHRVNSCLKKKILDTLCTYWYFQPYYIDTLSHKKSSKLSTSILQHFCYNTKNLSNCYNCVVYTERSNFFKKMQSHFATSYQKFIQVYLKELLLPMIQKTIILNYLSAIYSNVSYNSKIDHCNM